MITLKKRFFPKNLKKNEIVLDIETTGLDLASDKLVLLGLMMYIKDKAYIIQYFAEDDSEEERLIDIYLSIIQDKKLITYNGDRFDIPFLTNRAIFHKKIPTLAKNLDLLKLVKNYSYFFKFRSLKLVDIEKLFGILRVDPSRYKSISKLSDDILIRDKPYPILKHNENDLIGTELILDIENFLDNLLSFISGENKITLKSAYISNDLIEIKLKSGLSLGEAYYVEDAYTLNCSDKDIKINLQVIYGRFDSDTNGYVSFNFFNLVNYSKLKVDENLLIIKENRTYNYKNILSLSKKIIENHL